MSLKCNLREITVLVANWGLCTSFLKLGNSLTFYFTLGHLILLWEGNSFCVNDVKKEIEAIFKMFMIHFQKIIRETLLYLINISSEKQPLKTKTI